MTDQLELRYIPLSQARRWDENPKLHDLPALIVSIERYGFGDPPKFDAKLDGLVYGNGRTEALEQIRLFSVTSTPSCVVFSHRI